MSNIRYASIRELDISNGEGVGVALFVQGCHFHCKNCFNPETWDFNGGKEWTPEIKNKFMQLVDKPYITRVSLLGGEPLADKNLDGILDIVNNIRLLFPKKTIWLYTGFLWDDIWYATPTLQSGYDFGLCNQNKRKQIVSKCDVLIDGRYIESKRDITLHWKGSSNQRVIDIQKTLFQNKIVLYE